MKTSLLRGIVAIMAAIAVSGSMVATAQAKVDTVSAAKAFMAPIHSPAQFLKAAKKLTPAEERYVLRLMGKTTSVSVIERTGGAGLKTQVRRFSVKPGRAFQVVSWPTRGRLSKYSVSGDTSCPYEDEWHTQTYVAKSPFGDVNYKFNTQWHWQSRCWVHYAYHTEYPSSENWWWSYGGEKYGSPYGGLNTPMIGREEFAYFNYNPPLLPSVQQVITAQEKVFGGWGYPLPYAYWGWINITS